MSHPIGPLRALQPVMTDPAAPAARMKPSSAEPAAGTPVRDSWQTGGAAGGKALKHVGATLFPGSVGPSVLISGSIMVGLGAMDRMPLKSNLISAASYGGSMVAGNLAYRAVHALHGSEFAGTMAASAVGTAIGLGEAALLKRPASLISLLAHSAGANLGASQAARAIAKNAP